MYFQTKRGEDTYSYPKDITNGVVRVTTILVFHNGDCKGYCGRFCRKTGGFLAGAPAGGYDASSVEVAGGWIGE